MERCLFAAIPGLRCSAGSSGMSCVIEMLIFRGVLPPVCCFAPEFCRRLVLPRVLSCVTKGSMCPYSQAMIPNQRATKQDSRRRRRGLGLHNFLHCNASRKHMGKAGLSERISPAPAPWVERTDGYARLRSPRRRIVYFNGAADGPLQRFGGKKRRLPFFFRRFGRSDFCSSPYDRSTFSLHIQGRCYHRLIVISAPHHNRRAPPLWLRDGVAAGLPARAR